MNFKSKPSIPEKSLDTRTGYEGSSTSARNILAQRPLTARLAAKRAALGNSTICAAKNRKSELYELLKVARSVLSSLSHRTCGCLKYVASHNNPLYQVPVVFDGLSHSFRNVTVCGSVWTCPVCAYKIQSVRTNQLIDAMRMNRKLGGSSVFLTFTFPHSRHDKLDDLLVAFSKALRGMKGRRAYKKLIEKLGIHSKVRSLEVTWGEANGWHPHSHEVYFSSKRLSVKDIKAMELVFYEQWAKACVSAGLKEPSREYGLKIEYCKTAEDDNKIGSYMCKFAHEVTMSGSKVSWSNGRYTPFSMLLEIGKKYNFRLSEKFREYAEAFHGRRQICGLTELLKRFELDQVDEMEAAENGVESKQVDLLSLAEFNTISYFNVQSQFLGIYDQLGKLAARDYLKKLCIRRYREYNLSRDQKKSLGEEIKQQTFVAMIREGLEKYV